MFDENDLKNDDDNNAFDTIDKLFSDKPSAAEPQGSRVSPPVPKEEYTEIKKTEEKPEVIREVKPAAGGLPVSDSLKEPPLTMAKPGLDKKTEPDKADKMGELEMLEGYAMALEWEFTEKDIKKFNYHLNRLATQCPDNHNQVLIKLLHAIVSYISNAKEKAVPETMSVLSGVLKTLKLVNSGTMDKTSVKTKIQEAYQDVLNLKRHISSYNKEFNEEKEEVATREPEVVVQPPPPAPEAIPQSVLSRLDKLMSRLDELVSKLDEQEKRISYLEEQNKKLKNILIGL